MRHIMVHCTGMGIPISGDYTVSSFLNIFTPYMRKSHKNAYDERLLSHNRQKNLSSHLNSA